MQNDKPTCSLCPENTYSINGVRVPGQVYNWHTILPNMATYCLTDDNQIIDECEGWVPREDGEEISTSGGSFDDSNMHNEWTKYNLIYYTHLVKKGMLKLKYKKDSKQLKDTVNGSFMIFVNGDQHFIDEDLSIGVWNTIEIDLHAG